MIERPAGTVTFLFSDIEGSTELLRQLREQYAPLLADQQRILRRVFATWNGHEVGTQGDSFFVAFPRASDAVWAASDIQRALVEQNWPAGVKVRVRIGLHTGEPLTADDDYVGMDVHRAARIADVGHGDQVLLSETTAALVRDELPPRVSLLDLGRHRLKDMEQPEHIRQLVIEGLPSTFPPLSSLERLDTKPQRVPHNLPVQSTPFIGRFKELADIDALIADPDTRLVTIVGPGGMGKTRLALAAAESQITSSNGHEPRFPNGVFFVALEPLDSAEQIPASINNALGFRPSADDPGGRSPWQQTLDYLRSKHMLLIMDNFEQVLDGVAFLVPILETAPEITLLSTSREKLALRGERLYPLQGLHHPQQTMPGTTAEQLSDAYSAARFFIESARRLLPELTIKADEVTDLEQICRLVGGMPLALELAAGWVELLSLDDIVNEIKQSLDILETSVRDAPERQRSMSAVFESSWKRLDQDDQMTLKQLSVFRGGFTREAARQVSGASIRQLATLATKSLIQANKGRDRFQIHRLLRQYLAERLAEDAEAEGAVRDRHCASYCSATGRWAQDLKGARQREALVEMESDSLNIQTAWSWAVKERQVSRLDEAVEGLCLFYIRSGRLPEVEKACRKANERLSGTLMADEKRVLAKILSWQGWFLDNEPDYQLLQQSRDLLIILDSQGHDVRPEKARAWLRLGRRSIYHDAEEASKLISRSLTLYQALDDARGEADALEGQALLAWAEGSFDDDRELQRIILQKRNDLKDRVGSTASLVSLSAITRHQGHYDEAFALAKECISIYQEDHNLFGQAIALNQMAFALLFRGRFDEAAPVFREGLIIYEELGISWPALAFWPDLTEMMQGRYACVSNYYPIEQGRFESWNIVRSYLFCWLGLVAIAEGRYQEAWQLTERSVANCRDQNPRHDISVALAALALALCYLDKFDEAVSQLLEAIRIALDTRFALSTYYLFPAAAILLANLGRPERAVEIYELALQYPHVANAQLFDDIAGKKIEALAAALPDGIAEQMRQRGRELDPWETMAELQRELGDDLAKSSR